MKKVFIFYLLIVCLMLNTIQANNSSLIILSEMIEESQEIKPQRAKASTMVDTISIYGNENPLSLFLTGTGAIKEKNIQIFAPAGFKASKTMIPGNVTNEEVKISLIASVPKSSGNLVIIAGSFVRTIYLIGYATPLQEKDLSIEPVYDGGADAEFVITDADGFMPENGYTVEFTAKFPAVISYVYPYAITSEGSGFQAITSKEKIGISNAGQDWVSKNFSNPASLNGVFYPDDEFHTYRYAVTPDNRLFFYYDGGLVDIVRLQDFGLQKHMIEGEGDFEENLLVNGDFEGEYSFIKSDPGSEILGSIEGWAIGANDRWNSEQYIMKQEILGVSIARFDNKLTFSFLQSRVVYNFEISHSRVFFNQLFVNTESAWCDNLNIFCQINRCDLYSYTFICTVNCDFVGR
jgi:hypothetical protein